MAVWISRALGGRILPFVFIPQLGRKSCYSQCYELVCIHCKWPYRRLCRVLLYDSLVLCHSYIHIYIPMEISVNTQIHMSISKYT